MGEKRINFNRDEDFDLFKLYPCINLKLGCTEFTTKEFMETHANLRCHYRQVLCRISCDRFIPYLQLDNHEQNHCKFRIIQCDLCNASVVANEISLHLKKQCSERMLKCSLGCGRSFKASQLSHHESFECFSQCKYNCGFVASLEVLNYHQVSQCHLRPIACPNHCNDKNIIAQTLDEHLDVYCLNTLVACNLGCNAIVKRSELTSHVDMWSGSCLERFIYCPYNLIGNRIRIFPVTSDLSVESEENQDNEGVVLKFRRLDNIDLNTMNVPASTKTDQLFVRFSHRQAWIDVWTTKFIITKPSSKGSDEVKDCGLINISELSTHLLCECRYRKVLIPTRISSDDQRMNSIVCRESRQAVEYQHVGDTALRISSLVAKNLAV